MNGVFTIPLSPAGSTADASLADAPMAAVLEQSRAERAERGHFIAGDEHRLAAVAIERLLAAATTGAENPYNPLVLQGPPGTGKSHLARGVAATLERYLPRGRVICQYAVEFADALREANEEGGLDEWRRRQRRARLLVLEGVERLAGRAAAQRELLHTIDAVLAEGGQLVITSLTAPASMSEFLPALAGRLSAGLVAALPLPAAATRKAVLANLAAARALPISDEALALLADGLPVTVRELTGALLYLQNTVEGPITAEAAREYLAQPKMARTPSLGDIAALAAKHFQLSMAELRGPSRRRGVIAARGVAMLLARRLTTDSLARIGAYFGGRDHTTVMHACRRTERQLTEAGELEFAVNQLSEQLLTAR